MANFNSDGYIMIDLSDVDVTKSTQNVPGIYSRILNVIDANKLILIVNHQGLTPQAAICNKLLNYYVITTNLYIYKINSNDIVIIEQAGSSSVEVSIIPTLMSGTKIADFAIGSVEGSLYAPEFETEINDNVTASNSTWSSDKIDGELDLKANSTDLATVATTGSYNDLTNKPTIPTKTSDLTNDSGFITDADVPTIDDTTTANNKVWSSLKTSNELANKVNSADIATVATSGSYNDLTNKPTIPIVDVQRVTTGWGTSLTTNFARNHFLVLNANESLVVVWFASTNDILIVNLQSDARASGTGSVTQGNVTYTRNSNGTLTVSTTNNTTFTIIG